MADVVKLGMLPPGLCIRHLISCWMEMDLDVGGRAGGSRSWRVDPTSVLPVLPDRGTM